MINKKECPYCKKEIVYQRFQQFGGHCGGCNKSPRFQDRIEKIRQLRLNRRKDYEFKCKKCGKPYIVNLTPHLYEIGKYRKHCSRKCANSKVYSKETNIKRIAKIKEKIKLVAFGKHKYVYINGKQYLEHRYIMEQYLDRKLRPDELVHHKNGNRGDNRIENLEVTNKKGHSCLHRKKKYRNV